MCEHRRVSRTLEGRVGAGPSPALAGDRLPVPVLPEGTVPYLDLDRAATTPALAGVVAALDALVPRYGSPARGAGFKSLVTTRSYEAARGWVKAFVGARADDVAVFVRNTTEGMNLLASILPEDAVVVTLDIEHHADLLPWRTREVHHVRVPSDPAALLDAVDAGLATVGRPTLLAVTGASNVTGECLPIRDLAALAHRHGARIVVDAAQLAPHAPIDMAGDDLDYVALSGHKLYAPFGAGALVGRPDWMRTGEPLVKGGGAVRFVTLDEVAWLEPPERLEAGTPNVVGAVALGAACRDLLDLDMHRVLEHDLAISRAARERLAEVPGLRILHVFDGEVQRLATVTFRLGDLPHGLVAAYLGAEHGIGVRSGCFCAHPLLLRLLEVDPVQAEAWHAAMRRGEDVELPGATRASFGLGATQDDVERLALALERLVADGPRWTYRPDGHSGGWLPDPDPRGADAVLPPPPHR